MSKFSNLVMAKYLALLSLGDIGRRKYLNAHADIETIIIESFQSPSKEIRSSKKLVKSLMFSFKGFGHVEFATIEQVKKERESQRIGDQSEPQEAEEIRE